MRIAVATPHPRYRDLIDRLRNRPGWEVLVITDRAGLSSEVLNAFSPDYVFFPHWSHKISPAIYESHECVIFHMADVPYGRGGSPLQNLVRRGYRDTMLTALRCGAGLDAGPVYMKRPLSLLGTAEEILLRAATLMETMIVAIANQRPVPMEQTGESVTFRRLGPEDGNLSAARTIDDAFDMIRMLDADGYPPAFLKVGHLRIEFSRASLKPHGVHADARIVIDV